MSAAGGLDALLSVAQMPPGVPVACVGIDNPRNAAACWRRGSSRVSGLCAARSTTRPPREGVSVMPVSRMRSSRFGAGRTSSMPIAVRSTVRISTSESDAPMQWRMPPPNGM